MDHRSSRSRPDPAPHRAARLRLAIERDGGGCFWCRRPFDGLVRPTTDHLVPRVKGGPSWLENEVAACGRCNAERGHLSPVDWLQECRRRGWAGDLSALALALGRLQAAVAVRGGARRARPYLDAQLRRVAKLAA